MTLESLLGSTALYRVDVAGQHILLDEQGAVLALLVRQ
jgi:hypothetical protein